MSFERNLIYKVYSESEVFIETLDDVISNLSIEKIINGGDGDFRIDLDRKIDDFDENTSIKFNNRIKVYLKDSYNLSGTKLVAYGYITSYQPFLRDKKEGVEVTCLSAVSKLSNDFYRIGTAATASDLGVELTSQRVDEMMSAIINHYRSIETNSMINTPAGLDQTTDNSGDPFSFDHRFFNMKHLDSLREVSKFLSRNKTGGYWYYWRIDTDGDLILKNISTTADHTFIIGKHIKEISGHKTIEGMVNRVYFWNEKGTVDPDYIKITYDDVVSQASHDIISEYITDSKITSPNAASLLAGSRVYDKKDPKVKIAVTLNGNYDLASIEPGQTCQILNLKNNPYKVGADTVLIIQSIIYETDRVRMELSEAADNFEDIVENERQRLDKEMTWFGYITQQLTAAQLGPANRTWSSDIIFTATSGANAYRQVDWTAGIVYLPTSSGSDAGKRVVDAGNTGLMSAATDYYIYLDEETFNTSAANEDTGTGTIKQGGDSLLDAGKSWANDEYKGYIVTIGGQTKIIKSNTATVLSIEDRWTISDTVGGYTIKKMTFEVSSDKGAISSLTKIIFSNVKANSITTSEAIVVPTIGQSIIVDGSTQITKRSIIADRIVADTITAYEINTAAINIGVWGGDSSDISQATNYKFVTDNEKIGADRGYGGLNASNQITKGFLNTLLSGISLPTNGVRIDSSGIYGRKSGNTTFYISNTGDAYFSGMIAATSGYIGGVTSGWAITANYLTSAVEGGHSDYIELKASGPAHIKALYTTKTYIQMTAENDEPRIDLFRDEAGTSRLRISLRDEGIHFWDSSGAGEWEIYGDSANFVSTAESFIISPGTNIESVLIISKGSGGTYKDVRMYVCNGSSFPDGDMILMTDGAMHLSGTAVIPINGTTDLGISSYKWDNAHIKHLYSTSSNEFLDLTNIDGRLKQNLICFTDLGKNLGASGNRFASIFGQVIKCDSVRNNNGDLYIQFTTTNIDCFKPLILNELASDPGGLRGMIYFNTSINKIKVYTTTWETVTSS